MEKHHAIIKSSNHQIIKSSNHQIIKSSKSSVRTFTRLSSLAAIISFGYISQVQAVPCVSSGDGNWSTITWSCSHVPQSSESVVISSNTVSLNQDVTVTDIQIVSGATFNAGNYTLILSLFSPLVVSGSTFNANTSTVKLSDANHAINNLTLYNLQWATPLTAPRTLTIYGTITKAAGGAFNLDGTATNPVTFAGTGNFASPITVNNCAGKPTTMTNLTCNPPAAVSAPIDLHFSKQVETYSTEIELK